MRIRRSLRLAGRYVMASSDPVTLTIDGRNHAERVIDVESGVHDVQWEGSVPFPGPLRLVLVQERAID